MVSVFLTTVVSIAIVAFALMVIAREFGSRWAQIAAALSFDERAYLPGDTIRSVSLRQARLMPSKLSRYPAQQRAAAA